MTTIIGTHSGSFHADDVFAEPESQADSPSTQEVVGQGEVFEWTHRRSDGRDFPTEILLSPMKWEGVDVVGPALSVLVIARLPFAVPDKPLLVGRLEQIRLQGGNPFFDYQLPSAIIKFKQGFGRLIRSTTDTGIVVVLDSRIISKRYGARFLSAVPECTTKIVSRSDPHGTAGE